MKMILKMLYLTTMITMGLIFMASPAMALEKRPSDEKIAVVNGRVITREDFDREMNKVRQRLDRMGRPLMRAQLAKIEGRVLENLINNELLDQEAKKKRVKVDEQAVNEQFNKIKKRSEGGEKYKNALEKMNLTEADIKSQIEKGLSVQKLIDQEFVQKITVADEEIRAYYDGHPDLFKKSAEIRASHILIKVDSGSDESQKAASYKKIEEVQKKIEQGGDFAALAKEFSEGPSNVKGGDLGFFKRGQMVKPFEEVAFDMAPGEVSDIVETRFGYHLIKVFEKKPETISEYGEVKDKLQQFLKQQEVKKQLKDYIEGLKDKAKIERFLT